MNSLFDKPFTFDRVVRIVFGFLIFFGIVYLITLLKNALLPFLIAWLFAYMVQPIVKFFEVRLRLKSRILAIMATLFSLGAVVVILALTVFPSISMEAEKTLELLKDQDTGKGNTAAFCTGMQGSLRQADMEREEKYGHPLSLRKKAQKAEPMQDKSS